MFTATKLSDTINPQLQRRIIIVKFDDGVDNFTKEFTFGIASSIETIKRSVKGYLDEINSTPGSVNDFTPGADPAPKAEEIAKTEWQADWKNLQNAVKLEAHGVSVLTPAQMTTLKTKVKDNFLNSYKDLI